MIPVVAAALCVAAPCAFENIRVEVGDGTVLPSATVVVSQGKIQSVGAAAVPAGATRIDGTGKVLTPGFIETRTQLGLSEIGAEKTANDHSLAGATVAPAFRAADGFQPFSIFIPISREEGLTSAVTSPTGAFIYGTGAFFDLTGKLAAMPDPKNPVAMFGGIGQDAAMALGSARGGLWLRMREVIADARFYAKNRAAVESNRARTLSLSPLQLEAFLPVLEGKIPLVLEAHRASDILAALELQRSEKIRVILAGAAEAWKVADKLAAARMVVILTPSEQTPSNFDMLLARDDAASLLDKAGVPLVISTASWDQNVRRLRQEAGLAVAYGLPHERAVRAITLAPAEAFGKAAELGTITAGKRANLVLWSGDPLELSSVAEKVFIDGEEQPMENRQRKLVERYLAKDRLQKSIP